MFKKFDDFVKILCSVNEGSPHRQGADHYGRAGEADEALTVRVSTIAAGPANHTFLTMCAPSAFYGKKKASLFSLLSNHKTNFWFHG